MEKVKLPREIAEAIIYFRGNVSIEHWEQALLKVAMEHERYIGNTERCETIKEYVKSIDNLRLFMQALVNGFEIEEKPEDKVRNYVEQLREVRDSADLPPARCRSAEYTGRIDSVMCVLNLLGIKIEGVND